jgi:hypothetical protein
VLGGWKGGRLGGCRRIEIRARRRVLRRRDPTGADNWLGQRGLAPEEEMMMFPNLDKALATLDRSVNADSVRTNLRAAEREGFDQKVLTANR